MTELKLPEVILAQRKARNMTQEELASALGVTAQSVSNWENDKTYPDLKSLILLSEVFHVSLDTLIKGDIEIMKQEINSQEVAKFERDSKIFTVFFIAMLLLPIPLAHFLGWWGMALYLLVCAAGMYFAIRVEKHKKKYDIYTYKEILAFSEGKSLDEIEKAKESGKRPYQTLLLVVGTGVLAVLMAVVMTLLFRQFL